ncbi:MAG: FdhF/YdeP family oxidoreductase [Alphaproteobacteria bacterium]|nr:MAG: FdhF/YdeP family oxidoreductase [Alphaproteobacteria bacterium]
MKKVLYTLRTVKRMGLKNTSKAMSSKNTCKACALGMGGQAGGMTNEMGEFPSFCNKSIQAQSTDVQPPIPLEIFDHPLSELQELSGYELDNLGRLGTPLHKAPGSTRYQPISWDYALNRVAEIFAATDPNRTFFYSSGRSSNEAGFVLQLLARVYGTNNVNNCSYYCHQATSVALASSIGTGTSTIELEDLSGCDLIFVIGANPSSNHPRFIHKLVEIRERGGDVVFINPAKEPGLVKFAVPKSPKSMLTGGTEIASDYLQPKIGTDIALFKGIAKALVEHGHLDQSFLGAHTMGLGEFLDDIKQQSWDDITQTCGIAKADIERVADIYGAANKVVFAWGMGMTHHIHGVENIEYISNLALLRGMVGKQYAGLLPLRGHSNVQGIGTIGVKPLLADDVFRRMETTLGVTLPTSAGFDTMAGMHAAHAGDIDAALIMGGNLYGANPNTAWAQEALEKIGFKLFLTTTLNSGHVNGVESGESIVLPVTARDEEWQPTTQESMFNYIRLSDGGIDRLDNVRPETNILCDLAGRLMPDSPIDWSAFAQHSTIREAIAKIVPGLEELASIDVAKREFHVKGRLMHEAVFNTSDGKARFNTRPTPSAHAPDQLMLTTVRSEGQFNTIIYEEIDTYRQTTTRWSVMMAPVDISAKGLTVGDKITLMSDHGRMADVTLFAHDLAQGSVMAYFPEANVLIGTDVDPRSRTPSFKSTPVWIEA